MADLYADLGSTYTRLNQAQRAADAYQHALQLNPNSVEATAGLAEAKAAAGQTADAIALLQKGIALQSAGGAKAPEAWYKRAVAIAYKAKLPQAADLARDWVSAYPTKDSWENALAIYQLGAQLDESQTLDLMRLKRAAGVLTPADYFNYGDIAVRKGFAGEAKSVLEQGFAANLIKNSDPSFSQLYSVATAKTKGDLESLPAAPSATGTAKVTLNAGDAYYGYGKYDKAAEFYRAALSKAGADTSLINLHLGMALARQGDKAGAAAAFKAVSGANAALAQYWLLYASQA
jgi:tetratricopeptide (TPR) repeat protein